MHFNRNIWNYPLTTVSLLRILNVILSYPKHLSSFVRSAKLEIVLKF